MECCAKRSQTWHVEGGTTFIHVKHVGTRANVGACVLRQDILNGQDAIKVSGTVGKFPVTLSGPHQRVGRRLALGSTDEVDSGSDSHSLRFWLLNCDLYGFSWATCDNNFSIPPVGAMLASACADVDASVTWLEAGEVQLCSLSASFSTARDGPSILSRPEEVVRRRSRDLTVQCDGAALTSCEPCRKNFHLQLGGVI